MVVEGSHGPGDSCPIRNDPSVLEVWEYYHPVIVLGLAALMAKLRASLTLLDVYSVQQVHGLHRMKDYWHDRRL